MDMIFLDNACFQSGYRVSLYVNNDFEVCCNTSVYLSSLQPSPCREKVPLLDLWGKTTHVPKSLRSEVLAHDKKVMMKSKKFRKFLKICWKRTRWSIPEIYQ